MRMSLDEWWAEAARYLAAGVSPEQTEWGAAAQPGLFGPPSAAGPAVDPRSLDEAFWELADDVLCHRDAERQRLLYSVAWRLTHGSPALLRRGMDDQVRQLYDMRRSVARDIHQMASFLRFKKITSPDQAFYVAWYEPRHDIVERVAGIFRRRLADVCWLILTPCQSAGWDRRRLRLGPGLARKPRLDDACDDLWRTYYAATYNPARANPRLLKSLLPVRFWKNLPEADIIPALLARGRPPLS